jgi:hypothetical protein
MPENPNAKMPERTEPAVQPEVDGDDNPNLPDGLDTLTNPATVKAVEEFLTEQGIDASTVTITAGMWGWSEGSDIAHIETQGGNEDYFVSPDSDTSTRMAIALVTNDLNEEPGNFNESFISSYINTDRLRDLLRSDVEEMARETLREETPELSDDERESTPNAVDLDEAEIAFNEKVDQQVEQELKDPIQYLKDIYGDAEGLKQAMTIAGINVEEAAEDAVAADGEGHFLSSYDGDIHDLPSGGQWWRHN